MLAVPKRIVVGVSGGSGMLYALDLLRTLQTLPVETHLVVTNGAKQVIPTELEETVLDLEALAAFCCHAHDTNRPPFVVGNVKAHI